MLNYLRLLLVFTCLYFGWTLNENFDSCCVVVVWFDGILWGLTVNFDEREISFLEDMRGFVLKCEMEW